MVDISQKNCIIYIKTRRTYDKEITTLSYVAQKLG